MGGGGLPPARANAASISSCVRFLERRKEILLSTVDEATLGSWRTAAVSKAAITERDVEIDIAPAAVSLNRSCDHVWSLLLMRRYPRESP